MMRPALLVCALSAALLLCGVRAEGEPYVETSDGNLNLVTAAGKKTTFTGSDGSPQSLQEMADTLEKTLPMSAVSAMISDALSSTRSEMLSMQEVIDDLRESVADADASVADLSTALENAPKESDFKRKDITYTTHVQNPSGYHWFSVGTAETEDVLHLDVSDHGCNSGVGLSFTIVASHGLHLDIFPLATAAQAGTYDSNRENNIVLEYKTIDPDTYVLMVGIKKFGPCNGNTDQEHAFSLSVRSLASTFQFDEADALTHDDSFLPLPVLMGGYYIREYGWRANGDPQPIQTFAVGRAHVNAALKVTVSDEGCNSGAAATFHVFASWGVHRETTNPVAYVLGSAEERITDRMTLHWKSTAPDEYMIFVRMVGFPPCGSGSPFHRLRVSVQTDDQRFYPFGELDTPFDGSTFKQMPVTDISSSIDIETIVSSSGFSGAVSEAIVNEVGEDIDDTINTAIDTKLTAFAGSDALSGAIAGAFDTDAVQSSLAATVDKHLTRKRIEWSWVSHKPGAEGGTAIPLGLTRVDALVQVSVSDSGCNSGIGLDLHFTSRWGLVSPYTSKPKAYTMGGYAADELEDRFQLYYKAKDVDEYWVYLRITGWGSCGASTSGNDHMTEVVITSTDTAHDYDDIDEFDESTYTMIERTDVGQLAREHEAILRPAAEDAVALANLPFAKRMTRTWTGTATANQPISLFTGSDDFLSTGGYQFYLPGVHTAGKGGALWRESFVSSPFMWYDDGTNDQDDQYLEDIVAHSAGHANNGQDITFRVIRQAQGQNVFQFTSTTTWTAPVTLNFIFVQLF